ncbi:heavy metal translocating P-type ATPase [Terribacillus saccharophilus]|uniref:Cadmium-translocating P-type ATPase n=1 Tax=Terribacillus saccharophilus TaxID=361277 RepID=A0ABX4GYV2_9BACI|nr:heavy metal translocating P-type ATPase [Terribacillus saccharophilus]PAD35573.1 cadmium-translocating P-type ATPase [Terribacillus saccharophilus]PAD96466.1 cadmium-translocating P-type ATPase [Terribacillus saccharophilus]PAE00042.1 cadmium-translocating P-type ATPase [Terribacillus saccharophilus]
MKKHLELIAALVSGALILITYFTFHGTEAAPFLYTAAYLIGGFFKAKEGITETITERKLNVEMLMIFAAIGASFIGHWLEGALLIFIFALSGALETYTENRSSQELRALLTLQPDEATRLIAGRKERISIDQLQVDDRILVLPGQRIPADGIILKGTTSIDESAITGEGIPVTKTEGHEVFASTVNSSAVLEIRVTKPSDETLFQRIITMVQTAQEQKSPAQHFIERFEGPYVKTVLLLVLLVILVPPFITNWSFTESFYRAMILLVVASPCALVASVMPATLSAISKGARNGILVKGGSHLETLGRVKAVAFDKTGSLTVGKPSVTDFLVSKTAEASLVLKAAYAIQSQSSHPLAKAVAAYAHADNINQAEQVTDTAGQGMHGIWQGQKWRIGKISYMQNPADQDLTDQANALAAAGKSLVYIENEYGLAGVFALQDTIRPEAKAAIRSLSKLGISTIMLTGDNDQTAKAIAKEAGITMYRANCLPDEKVAEIKKLESSYGTIAMVGDGINDAPALATAQVGIAMGNGTDAALETADMVLIKNDLGKLADAVKLSKRMRKIIKQNVIFSVSVILLLILANISQYLGLPLGVVGHEGSTILVILNGLRLLR